jgi:class 3 adenylate cyclase/YHS domain-containing protein
MEKSDRNDVQTFLFADLAGFAALTEAHGDQAAAELARDFCNIVRGILAIHRGEEVKTIGDAVMVVVPDAADAIRLGLDIVNELRTRPKSPVVHVGMHTGPAVRQDGDWFGSTVNIAARVAAAAGGDEVLLTNATRQAAGQIDGVELEARGEERFRNIVAPIQLFRAAHQAKSRHDTFPIDPVCRMAVTPEHCAAKLVYEGVEFCFCSLECVSAFSAHPARFLNNATRR